MHRRNPHKTRTVVAALAVSFLAVVDSIGPTQGALSEAEQRAGLIEARLATIRSWLTGEAAMRPDAIAVKGFSCGPLRPARPDRVRVGEAIAGRRQVPGASGEGKAFTGPEGLGRALGDLGSVLEGPHEKVEFLVTGLERESESAALATVLFNASGRGPEGLVEQSATWRMRWEIAPDGAPFLQRIEVEGYQEVLLPGGDPLFSDCTESVLGGNDSFRGLLLPGVDHWLERLESWIESDSFGHHGIAVGDATGDGLDDLYVSQMGGLPNLLYAQKPDGTAADVSAAAGVDWLERSRGALFLDLDNDGDQDLAVATSVALIFLANDGQGRFTLRASYSAPESGVKSGEGGRSLPGLPDGGVGGGHYSRAGDIGGSDASDLVMLAAADYDNDGFLDVYACAYHASSRAADSFPYPVPYHDANNGGSNILLRNDGSWGFADVTEETGLNVNNKRFSFAASWEDYDNDGDQDLYVANDFGRKNLYRNDGGRFTDVADRAGVEDIGAGMSASWGDYDNDGWMDLYVGNMFTAHGTRLSAQPMFQMEADAKTRALYERHARGNSLFRNRGDGSFSDVSVEAGVTMGRWAWASLFADLDNNGWEDFIVANGYFTREDPEDLGGFFWKEVVGRSPLDAREGLPDDYLAAWKQLNSMVKEGRSIHGSERKCAYLNPGSLPFVRASAITGLDFVDDGRAAALTDWDLDGDLDVWLANRTGPRVRFARNETDGENRFVAFQLEGRTVNRDAIGARLELKLSGGSGSRFRTLRAGEGYLGQSSKWVHFGIGGAESPDRLVVRWPGGASEEFSGIEPGRRYRIVQGAGTAALSEAPSRKVILQPSRLEATAREERSRVFLSAPVPAPVLAYRDLDDRPMTHANTGPVLVVLWSAGCDACFDDLARLAGRKAELEASGLAVLALNVGAPESEGTRARDRIAKAGLPFAAGFAGPALRDKLDLIQKKVIFRARPITLPSSFLIDADDLLAAIYRGPLSIEELMRDLPGLQVFGERRLKVALPAEGRRQTRGWPSFFDYMDSVASAYAEGGFPEEAVAYYRKVMRIKPGRIESHVNLASALSTLGRTDEAIAEYRSALAIDPDHAGAHRGLGDELGKQGDQEQAIVHYRAALESSPDDPRVLSNLALALSRAGREDEAVSTYRRALAIEPDNVIALVNLGMALERQGMEEEAIQTLRRAVAADPGSPQAAFHLGRAFLRRGDTARAIRHLEDAVSLQAGFGQARYHLAIALAKQGRWEEAARHLSDSGRGMPGFAPEESLVWILATDAEAGFRDGARAVDLAEKLLARAGDGRRVAALDALAAAYAEAGRFGDAVETAREAERLALSQGLEDTLRGIRFRLSAYEAGKPFHRGR